MRRHKVISIIILALILTSCDTSKRKSSHQQDYITDSTYQNVDTSSKLKYKTEQVIRAEIRQQVLEKNFVDSLFVFGKWTEDGETETRLKYLGEITTTDGRIFKIMNSIWFWGLSHRATCRLLMFDDHNQYLGNYRFGGPYELPDKLENGCLIFKNFDNVHCDKKIITKVDFTLGLPKEIFIKCKGKYGDIFKFDPEEYSD
jgi:hypothetical protein